MSLLSNERTKAIISSVVACTRLKILLRYYSRYDPIKLKQKNAAKNIPVKRTYIYIKTFNRYLSYIKREHVFLIP